MKITIVSSRTDVYRDGSSVLLARTGTVTCPYTILSRYFHLAALNCYSSDFVFRNLVYHKSSRSYSLGSRPTSYSRARELLLNSLVELGFPKSSYGDLVVPLPRRMLASAIVCLNGMVVGNRIVQRTAMLKTTSIPFFQFLVL